MAGAPAVSARYIIGDCLEQLRKLDDNSVDLVFSSPPFLALRSYLPADHPDKAKEIGSEPTPGDFIDALLDVVEECARVLAPHGSLCFELGDTYSGSAGNNWDKSIDVIHGATALESAPFVPDWSQDWPLSKSLALIPESFRWALAYGRNPFNGRTTDPWRVRNVVRWHRPNPPVGALGDKFRPSTSDVVVACTSTRRYFDLDAVRSAVQHPNATATSTTKGPGGQRFDHYDPSESAGAPPLDTWIIPTAPYRGSHYATFPPALVIKPVLSMCPERVCVVCGEPSRRIVERESAGVGFRKSRENLHDQPTSTGFYESHRETLGWTDCGHDNYRPGVVLDPFAGSGTVLAVATGHGRDAIGIDLDERNAYLAQERVGMFLTVEWSEAWPGRPR